MLFVALDEAARKGQLILNDGGMCRWHRRRDGVVVIREILVLPHRRMEGIAREMLYEVAIRNPTALLRARCPVDYDANGFWKRMGFRLAEEGSVNVWELQLSSGAPMEIWRTRN